VPNARTRGTSSASRLSSVLKIAVADETTWVFDIPKLHLKRDREVAAALAPARPCARVTGRPDRRATRDDGFVVWMPGALTLLGKTLEALRIRPCGPR